MSYTTEEDKKIRGDFRVLRLSHSKWQVAYRNFLTGITMPIATDLDAEQARELKEVLNDTLFNMLPKTSSIRNINAAEVEQVRTPSETETTHQGSVEEESQD